MKNKVVLFCFEQDSWWLFHVIWHLPPEIFPKVEDWDEAIDNRVLSFRDWTLASLIWKTSRVSMRTRWTYARKNLVRLANLHQPTWKKDSTWWNHSKNPSKLKNVVDSKYSTKVTQASCSNFSPCSVPEVVWIGRYSGESQTPRS